MLQSWFNFILYDFKKQIVGLEIYMIFFISCIFVWLILRIGYLSGECLVVGWKNFDSDLLTLGPSSFLCCEVGLFTGNFIRFLVKSIRYSDAFCVTYCTNSDLDLNYMSFEQFNLWLDFDCDVVSSIQGDADSAIDRLWAKRKTELRQQ